MGRREGCLISWIRKNRGFQTSTELSECIVIPMGNDTELNVYCSEPDKEEREYCSWSKFIMKLKWQPRGYARAIEW
ncbi:hypothetical protein CRE_12057 [Caenorhabditis remanei]|uniref:Uncharacterized protein n=1 Tax=Caenorhabditis remanei TaxID=31234 RepID=E3MPP1_CAERE|nr:hypothetical protein CRE_12057 [Caenorhabditis remanei]